MPIMLWVYASLLWRLVRNLILEFIFFILVDVVAKTPLRDAANDAEKRTIWLCEAVVLLGLCGLIYWADHTPYLLLVLSAATGIYTQLYGRINLRQWWTTLCTRWEEYQQHEESMRQVQAHIARQQASTVSQQATMGTSPLTGLSSTSGTGSPHIMPSQGYPPNVTLLTRQEIPGSPPSTSGPVFRSSQGGLIWSGMSQSNNASGGYFTHQSAVSLASNFGPPNTAQFINQQVAYSAIPPADRNCRDSASSRWFGGDLRRKPLRQFESRILNPSLGLASSGAASIKNRFMNALGFGEPVQKPPGLRNKGQNQCFMNSVLQCLARSPYLAQFLAVDAAKELEGTVSESLFLSALSELLDLVTAEPETLETSVLDPIQFRQAAAALNRNLVTPVGQPQVQQDAAEFLMWMLDMVHNILNRNRQALSCGADSGSEERFSSPRLAMLRFIYGDLTPTKAKELKEICMREIELANGLENDSYAESIQRLSDLEWLLHKQSNESIVDDLFTGQLVEALLCTSNNRISVTLQTFNVLPVPLAAPRPVSGLVLLEDCFTAFCHIEHLVNSTTLSGAATDFAYNTNMIRNRAGDAVMSSGAVTPQSSGPKTRSSSTRLWNQAVDSNLPTPLGRIPSAVSPIIGQRESQFVNDSGFYDNVFRTSTPIREAVGGVIATDSTNVQRRCLLRQLPECLIIQLMRFQYNIHQGRSNKLRAPVSVRLKGLDLEALVYDTVTQREDLASPAGITGPQIYDLYGLCLHLGAESTHHGHYVSYSLAADGRWYRFDDESVTQVNMEYELTTKEVRQNAYILFYKRAAG